jgi:hypothetical protein
MLILLRERCISCRVRTADAINDAELWTAATATLWSEPNSKRALRVDSLAVPRRIAFSVIWTSTPELVHPAAKVWVLKSNPESASSIAHISSPKPADRYRRIEETGSEINI